MKRLAVALAAAIALTGCGNDKPAQKAFTHTCRLTSGKTQVAQDKKECESFYEGTWVKL